MEKDEWWRVKDDEELRKKIKGMKRNSGRKNGK